MAENSKIAWTTHTFNPWIGCTKVHEGCAHCYAESFAKRTGKATWGPRGTRVKTSEPYWRKPLKWDREAAESGERPRVFCASMADVFEEWGTRPVHDHRGNQCVAWHGGQLVLDDLRDQLFDLIDSTPNLDWLLLTKRPENIRRMWCSHSNTDGKPPSNLHRHNVWLGTSVSNQATMDRMTTALLDSRDLSPVLFLSAEPLLGPIDMNGPWESVGGFPCPRGGYVKGIDQVIIGVESSGTRLGSLGEFASEAAFTEAVADIVLECRQAGVSAFVKQMPINGRLSHDPAEWLPALRVRQFPVAATREGE